LKWSGLSLAVRSSGTSARRLKSPLQAEARSTAG
jgi:hypothetical protein